MSIKSDKLISDYSKYKTRAFEFFKAGEIERALICIKFCGFLAYNFPVLETFCDDDLEMLLLEIGGKLTGEYQTQKPPSSNRVVFYDSLSIDNSGLTQQYLRYLISEGYEVLFIVGDASQLIKASDIVKEVESYEKGHLYVCPEKSQTGKIVDIMRAVGEFAPASAFLHMAPNDASGVAVFSRCSQVKRYFINLTDHAFWLGKSCGDIFLEFRKVGYSISVRNRGIAPEKLRINYYYPIQKTTEFQGFAFDTKDKVIGFAGGSLYKILADKDEVFLRTIAGLLKDYDNFLFILAGWGNTSRLNSFIKNNNLEKKLYYIGKRSDIDQVFKRIDIYFNTYPFMGGLMTHYAINNDKAVVGLVDPELRSLNSLEGFLDLEGYITPSSQKEFFGEASRLIADENYREDNARRFAQKKVTNEDFNSNLTTIIRDGYSNIQGNDQLELSYEKYLKLYVDYENNIERSYYYQKVKMLKSCMQPQEIAKTLGAVILWNNRKLKTLIVNRIKKRLLNK